MRCILTGQVRKSMRITTLLIKSASGMCNMQCDYCFYRDETTKREVACYGQMTEETLKNIIKKALFQAKDNICFAFQGGEPTIRGIEFYKKVIEFEERFNKHHVRISNTLQTNGTLIDETWSAFFRDYNFLLGVSVDGVKSVHDRYRHDENGGSTYEKVRKGIRLLEKYKVDYNILTVVTRQAAERICEIYREYKINGWNFQQYIVCLDPAGETPGKTEYSLTPELFGRFWINLFELWYKDWKRGKAPCIRQFENYIGILLGYPPESCDQRGTCSIQCVVEADGSVYPCDFYALDKYKLGSFDENSVTDLTENKIGKDFVEDSRKLSGECMKCCWYPICRSGCRRQRIQIGEGDEYINYFCNGYKMFFEKCFDRLNEIARYIKDIRNI